MIVCASQVWKKSTTTRNSHDYRAAWENSFGCVYVDLGVGVGIDHFVGSCKMLGRKPMFKNVSGRD